MECRNFKLTLKSATNLPDIRIFGDMKVYGKVSLRGVADTTYYTSVDEAGGTRPKWNAIFGYRVPQLALEHEGILLLDIELYCQRTLGDRHVGQVSLDLSKVFRIVGLSNTVNFTVDTEDGQPTEGKLELSYTFGDLTTVAVKKNHDAFFEKGVIVMERVKKVVEVVAKVAEFLVA